MLRDVAREYGPLLAWAFGLSTALLVLSVVLAPVVIARMRVDYFTRRISLADDPNVREPAGRILFRALKNVLGALLLLAGLAMLVLPGQGILTLLAALALLDFPGKRQIQLRLAQMRHVRRTLQWLRHRAGQPPLELD